MGFRAEGVECFSDKFPLLCFAGKLATQRLTQQITLQVRHFIPFQNESLFQVHGLSTFRLTLRPAVLFCHNCMDIGCYPHPPLYVPVQNFQVDPRSYYFLLQTGKGSSEP